MLMTFLNSRLIRRIGAPRMLRLGLRLLCLAGVLQLVMALSGWGGLWGIVLPVVLYVGQIGLVGANAMSETMGHFPANAGTASAVTGTLRFLAGALAGVAVNLVPASSPVPMALVMAGCGLCALLAHGWLAANILLLIGATLTAVFFGWLVPNAIKLDGLGMKDGRLFTYVSYNFV